MSDRQRVFIIKAQKEQDTLEKDVLKYMQKHKVELNDLKSQDKKVIKVKK